MTALVLAMRSGGEMGKVDWASNAASSASDMIRSSPMPSVVFGEDGAVVVAANEGEMRRRWAGVEGVKAEEVAQKSARMAERERRAMTTPRTRSDTSR